jgi:multidrug efflux pump subunit AcrB
LDPHHEAPLRSALDESRAIPATVASAMPVGLTGETAILIAEFARVRPKAGEGLCTAVRKAARRRLRPIVTTSKAVSPGALFVPLLAATIRRLVLLRRPGEGRRTG